MSTPNTLRYRDYVGKVQAKRLHYVSNINVMVAVVASVVLALPFPNRWLNIMLTLVVRAPVIYAGLWLVVFSRSRSSTTLYPNQVTMFGHFVASAFAAAKVMGFYCVSAYSVAAIVAPSMSFRSQYFLVSKEFRARMFLNDEWVFYWCYPVMIAGLYAYVHMMVSRNRLVLNLGLNPKRDPQTVMQGIPKMLINTIAFTTFLAVVGWPTWLLIRPVVYSLAKYAILVSGLDPQVPPKRLHFGTWMSLLCTTGATVFTWEVINHTFNVYSTIGCLDGKKPLSTYAPEPIHTLINGLNDEDEFVQAMAWQEMAYIASNKDTKQLRDVIYNRTPARWQEIYDSATRVINSYCDRVNYRNQFDIDTLKSQQVAVPDLVKLASDPVHRMGGLFGNSESDKNNNSSSSTVKPYSELIKKSEKTPTKPVSWIQKHFAKLEEKLKPTVSAAIKLGEGWQSRMETKQFLRVKNTVLHLYSQFLHSGVGVLFRVYAKHDAEARVRVISVVANAAIVVSQIVIHAVEDDRSETIANRDICEVLNCLEKPARASLNYIEHVPASVYGSGTKRVSDQVRHTAIATVHDDVMDQFCSVCLHYNYKFDDLVVNVQTQRLASRVIQASKGPSIHCS